MSLAKVGIKLDGSNPVVDFYKSGDSANSMFRLINETNEFKLK